MALKSYKPTTPGQRGLVLIDRSELWKGRPVKSLTEGLTKNGGRNNTGRITMRRKGGGAKRLYRIVDFSESRDILEQLFGLKTVSIYSGDRTNPKLDIYGVKEKLDVVAIIRERVEYNKRRKGIYEITNR